MMIFSIYYTVLHPLMNLNSQSVLSGFTLLVAPLAYLMIT